ncbi:hypothetical protein ACKUUM_28080 [Klebsiella oxytoca]
MPESQAFVIERITNGKLEVRR